MALITQQRQTKRTSDERRAGGIVDVSIAKIEGRGENSRSRKMAGIYPAQFSQKPFVVLPENFFMKNLSEDDEDRDFAAAFKVLSGLSFFGCLVSSLP